MRADLSILGTYSFVALEMIGIDTTDLAFEGPRYGAAVFRQALDYAHGQVCRNCREQRQTSRRASTVRAQIA